MTIIAPSILSMDFTDTKSQIEQLNNSSAKWMHFDVMDGHFVPNLTFGPDILKAMKRSSQLLLDVHVMIEDPEKYADIFIDAGAEVYTFHYEVFNNDEQCLALCKKIQAKGCKAGLSIKPKTEVDKIKKLISHFDLILVMSVEPGFGGQSFDENAPQRIAKIKRIIEENQSNTLIEVDGGINEVTSKLCVDVGADVLVAGSYIFKQNIKEAIESLL